MSSPIPPVNPLATLMTRIFSWSDTINLPAKHWLCCKHLPGVRKHSLHLNSWLMIPLIGMICIVSRMLHASEGVWLDVQVFRFLRVWLDWQYSLRLPDLL
jgi:hypothetical protein